MLTDKLKQINPINKIKLPSVSVPVAKILRSKVTMIFMIIGIIGAFMFSFKDTFITALVNGKPVYRWEVISRLEKQQGKEVLDAIITERIIADAGKKAKIEISKDDIDSEMKKLDDTFKAQGQTLDQFLAAQGYTRKEVENQIKLQKVAEKLITQNVTVSDQEVEKYLLENKSSFPEGTDMETIKPSIKEQLTQEKMSMEFEKWLQSERTKAGVIYLK